MKLKADSSKKRAAGNAIITILHQELQNLETNIENRFVGFDKKVDQKFVTFEAKMDFKLDNLERRVDEKAQQYRDQILTSNDKLAKTLETMKEEITIGNFQTREKLEDHEKELQSSNQHKNSNILTIAKYKRI